MSKGKSGRRTQLISAIYILRTLEFYFKCNKKPTGMLKAEGGVIFALKI